MEDKTIIDLFFDRSEQALKELGTKYGRLCHQVSFNILNNQEDAEECVNDAYLGVWNSIPPTRPDSLMAYVCRITRNLSLKKYEYNTAGKRNGKFDAALDELEGCLSAGDSVEEELEAKELTHSINRFLSKQKPEDRIIFMRRYYFSDSYEDIAERTGLTVKNISVRLTRVRERLRIHLQKEQFI